MYMIDRAYSKYIWGKSIIPKIPLWLKKRISSALQYSNAAKGVYKKGMELNIKKSNYCKKKSEYFGNPIVALARGRWVDSMNFVKEETKTIQILHNVIMRQAGIGRLSCRGRDGSVPA